MPFLKVDKGLAPEQDGVQLMKPIDTRDDLLGRARRHQIFGTRTRSVINDADEAGISAIADQQFGYAGRILAAGLVPIIEPEVSISSRARSRLRRCCATPSPSTSRRCRRARP
jgi:fructose-bisphosphate aldolase, class I